MNVVYLVAVHRNAAMYGELLGALSPARVITHVDAKVDISPFAGMATKHPNVRFTQRRVDVKWGGWSQVDATLVLLSEALPEASDEDYIVLLSGDSYPLRTQAAILHYFHGRGGRQFLQAVPMPVPRASREPRREFGSLTRISQVMLEYDREIGPDLMTKIVNRLPLYRPFRRALGGRTPYTGSQWWAITGAAARWVLAAAQWDRRFVRLCRTSAVPDEFFFQTLIMNSPHGAAVSPSLMYVDWARRAGNSPALIDEDSIAELRHRAAASDPADAVLFARKVADPRIARAIRDQVWPAAPAPE